MDLLIIVSCLLSSRLAYLLVLFVLALKMRSRRSSPLEKDFAALPAYVHQVNSGSGYIGVYWGILAKYLDTKPEPLKRHVVTECSALQGLPTCSQGIQSMGFRV